MAYVAIAYRYGWTNTGEWYFLYAGENLDNAVNAAIAENASRGGKYGCAVYEVSGCDEEKIVHYSPSAWGEEAPRFCAVDELRRQVGYQVMEAMRKGTGISHEEIAKCVADEKQKINIFHPGSFD